MSGTAVLEGEGRAHEGHRIFIFVNEQRVGPFEQDEVTGAQIKEKAGVSLDSDLFRKEGSDLIPVKNDELVKIHENERFIDLVPTPVS